MSRREFELARRGAGDPLDLLRRMTSEFDRVFDRPAWPSFRWSGFRALPAVETNWFPEVDVFEKDNRLVTRIDLPGVKKENVKVEVIQGQLVIAGERKSEVEEKKEDFYRCEREYGRFSRTVPLPDGVNLDHVQATFSNGVLEVSVPLPARAEVAPRRVEIQEPAQAVKAA